jgi:hypothetical protein
MNLNTRGNHEVGVQVRVFEPNQVAFVSHGMTAFNSQGFSATETPRIGRIHWRFRMDTCFYKD